MKIHQTKKAFTLIEILIATAIFATVMIIVVATFSWAVGYNNRLKETRRVGQEVRNATDQLTRDIRVANGGGKIKIGSATSNIGEITLMICSSGSLTSCSPVFQTVAGRYKNDLSANTDPSGTAPLSNAIFILNKDNNRATLYRSVLDAGENYKLTVSVKNNVTDFSNLNISDFGNSTTLHPDNKTISVQAFFGGYGATKTGRIQQSYAEIYLIGKTYNYNSIQPNMRSRFHLRSMSETRDYNP